MGAGCMPMRGVVGTSRKADKRAFQPRFVFLFQSPTEEIVPCFPALLPTYNRTDIAFVRGEGSYLFAEDGKRYLDFGAGIAVNAFGHANPRLVAALTEQAGKLWHTSNLYRVPGQESLAKKLVANTFADTVFFTNSGAEASNSPSRWRGAISSSAAIPNASTSSASKAPFTAAPWRASLPAGNEKYLEGFGPQACRASTRCRSAIWRR